MKASILKSIKLITLSLPLSLLTAASMQAKVLFDLDKDFTPRNLKSGVSFQSNPAGVEIDNTNGYKDLHFVEKGNYFIAEEGIAPGKDTLSQHARWLKVYRLVKAPDKEPVPGIKYNVVRMAPGDSAQIAADGIDHSVIASNKIQPDEAGNVSIENSRLTRIDKYEFGQIKIFVNNTHIGEDVLTGIGPSAFDVDLDYLRAGDVIHIALGPGKSTSIGFIPTFQIVSN